VQQQQQQQSETLNNGIYNGILLRECNTERQCSLLGISQHEPIRQRVHDNRAVCQVRRPSRDVPRANYLRTHLHYRRARQRMPHINLFSTPDDAQRAKYVSKCIIYLLFHTFAVGIMERLGG
jgi:hypothetical protein